VKGIAKVAQVESRIYNAHIRLLTLYVIQVLSHNGNIDEFVQSHLNAVKEQTYNDLYVPLSDLSGIIANYKNKDKGSANLAVNLVNVFEMYSEKMKIAVEKLVGLGKARKKTEEDSSYLDWMMKAFQMKIEELQNSLTV